MRPQIQKNKLHPVEDDVNLTPAQKRYARVKRWTKHVNIFEKDFVVVPINEHSHWFVAVICFPGLEGCQDFETDEPCGIPDRQQKATELAAEKNKKNKARKKELGDKKVMQVNNLKFFILSLMKLILCEECNYNLKLHWHYPCQMLLWDLSTHYFITHLVLRWMFW